ncbi:hypothetical protein CRYUN_Cryun02cG0135700 [Craigia yunnanensis]
MSIKRSWHRSSTKLRLTSRYEKNGIRLKIEEKLVENIARVETHNMPDITMLETPVEFPLLPPATKRPPGRPKVKRIESQFITRKKIQCSKCKELGYNWAT